LLLNETITALVRVVWGLVPIYHQHVQLKMFLHFRSWLGLKILALALLPALVHVLSEGLIGIEGLVLGLRL
jgi:hypothetical protein